MQAVIDAAQPMVNLLWQRETEGRDFDSPERKAALDKTLRTALKRISDPSIRRHYADEVGRLRTTLFGHPPRASGPRAPWRPGQKAAPQPASPSARRSQLARGQPMDEVLREALILATLILHPGLISRFESALSRLDLTGDDHN